MFCNLGRIGPLAVKADRLSERFGALCRGYVVASRSLSASSSSDWVVRLRNSVRHLPYFARKPAAKNLAFLNLLFSSKHLLSLLAFTAPYRKVKGLPCFAERLTWQVKGHGERSCNVSYFSAGENLCCHCDRSQTPELTRGSRFRVRPARRTYTVRTLTNSQR